MSKRKDNDFWIILGGLLLILLLVVFLFGDKITKLFSSNNKQSEEQRKEKLEKEHQELTDRININLALKEELAKKFKRSYFIFRIWCLIGIIVFSGVFYYFFGYKQDFFEFLDKLVNVYELIILWFGLTLFVSYGNFNGFKDFIERRKKKIEIKVYKNHLDIDEKIQTDVEKKGKVELELKQFPSS